MAKGKPTAAQIANDASLRWCPYRMFELVYSDTHGRPLRFVRYASPGQVVLATLGGMGELPGTVHELTVRRPSTMQAAPAPLSEAEKGPSWRNASWGAWPVRIRSPKRQDAPRINEGARNRPLPRWDAANAVHAILARLLR